MPPTERPSSTPWPYWPAILRTSSSHQEGAERKWAVNTKRFIDNGSGAVKAIELVEVKFENGQFIEIEGSAKEIPADLVLLAMGFVHPVHEGLLKQIQDMGAELDSRGNVKAEYGDHANAHRTKIDKVFVAGDMRRGQSLIVWAIAEGRKAANSVNAFLGVTVN
ncbi:MAG: FAD-dependent oxidoreductase, partial [Leptospiraceae bacterium]|nr:FAD-dependent oxidoreductase [Leptospiraceae bacterium]